MIVQDSAERIGDIGLSEGVEKSQPIQTIPVEAKAPKNLGFAWKCLIIFAAALIGQAILNVMSSAHPNPDAHHTFAHQAASFLGGATALFLMSIIVAGFVRGSTGAIAGVILVGVSVYLIDYGTSYNAKPTQRHAAQASETFRWQPSGNEYSVAFAKKPKISEFNGIGDSGEVNGVQAECFYPAGNGFERAMAVPIKSGWKITRESEKAAIANWAREAGMEYYQMEFEDSDKDDLVTRFKGTRHVSTDSGSVNMSFIGERHWAKSSGMSLLICAPVSENPTPDGIAFLQSIRRQK